MKRHKKIPLPVRVHRQGGMAIAHHEDICIIPHAFNAGKGVMDDGREQDPI